MAYTYDLTTSIGQVRLLIPDNDSTAYDLQDAEITWFLSQVGSNVNRAAVSACKWLARKYSKKATFQADGLSLQNTQRAQEFAARARELEAELCGGIGSVELTREDGYHDNAQLSEYERQARIIYIDVQ